jgi:hypothetical protein
VPTLVACACAAALAAALPASTTGRTPTATVPVPSAGDITIATFRVAGHGTPHFAGPRRIGAGVSATVSARRTGRRRSEVLVVVARRNGTGAPGGSLHLSLGAARKRKLRKNALSHQKPTSLPGACRDNAPNPLARLPRRLRRKLRRPSSYLHPWPGVSAQRFQRQLFLGGTCWRPLAMRTYSLLQGIRLGLGAASIRSGSDNVISFSPAQLTPNVGVWVAPGDGITAVDQSPGFRFGVVSSTTGSWSQATYALAQGPFRRDQQHTIVFETRTSAGGEPTEVQKVLLVPPGSTAVAGPSFEIK